jgi:predicted PhzF superfamily epimerase YddE/YHI9
MSLLHILHVFTDKQGAHGNPLGVFLAGGRIDEREHQSLASALGFSETVFVQDVVAGALRLYTPASELPFAGHPLVGTAWLLAMRRGRVPWLRPPAGAVQTWWEGDLVWIRAPADWCPAWSHVQLESPAAVEAADGPPAGHDHVQIWAFDDEASGAVRARVFAPRFGVAEDEACGSASMRLAVALGRQLTIHHGRGSEIFVRPGNDGQVELGGRVRMAARRAIGQAADAHQPVGSDST